METLLPERKAQNEANPVAGAEIEVWQLPLLGAVERRKGMNWLLPPDTTTTLHSPAKWKQLGHLRQYRAAGSLKLQETVLRFQAWDPITHHLPPLGWCPETKAI